MNTIKAELSLEKKAQSKDPEAQKTSFNCWAAEHNTACMHDNKERVKNQEKNRHFAELSRVETDHWSLEDDYLDSTWPWHDASLQVETNLMS